MGIMPHRLEKGLFPTVVECFFNDGLDQVPDGASVDDIIRTSDGARRRLRAIWRYCAIGQQLRTPGPGLAQVTKENSFILSSMFDIPAAGQFQASIARDWLGMERVGEHWERRLKPWPTDPAVALPTLGQWSGYYGNVELILVEALQRMLEVSLGVDHVTTPPAPAQQKALEEALGRAATRVWPVYMFLTCPQPWFETWVTWQCHARGSPLRGQVTVMLSTPGHARPVAPSPVDLVGDASTAPVEGMPGATVPNPYFLYGVGEPGERTGYAGKVLRPGTTLTNAAPTVVVTGQDPQNTALHDDAAGQGMWVITHANHDSTVVWTSFVDPPAVPNLDPARQNEAEAWDLAPIAHYRSAPLSERHDVRGLVGGAIPVAAPADTEMPEMVELPGCRDIVVVSPAARDGGVLSAFPCPDFPPPGGGTADD